MGCLTLIVVLLFMKLIQRFGFIFRALDYLTMPGAIFHELGHYLCCKAHRIHVFHVDWFHWGYMLDRERASRETENRLGAVWRAKTPNIFVQFQISAAPLLSCGICWLIAVVGLHLLLSETSPFNAALTPALETIVIIILLWIGLASADRMLPSEGDMKNVLKFKERDPISVVFRTLAHVILAINKLLYRIINGVPAWGRDNILGYALRPASVQHTWRAGISGTNRCHRRRNQRIRRGL